MEQRVKDIIESALNGAEALMERLPGGRVSGSVIWGGFDGKDDVERQQMLRKLLEDQLGRDILDVGILLTYTPDEVEVMQAA